MNELLESFPVVTEIPVAWGDMNAFEHVSNISYFRYLEEGIATYYEKLKILELKNKAGTGPVFSLNQCKYKLELTYPDTVSVGTRIDELEVDRFVFKSIVFSHRNQKIAAYGETRVAFIDLKKKQRTPIPEEIIQKILHLEKSCNTLCKYEEGAAFKRVFS